MKVRSMVGLIPLFAVETLDSSSSTGCRALSIACSGSLKIDRILAFTLKPSRRTERCAGSLSLVNRQRPPKVLRYLLDERGFVSVWGKGLVPLSPGTPLHPVDDGHDA